MGYEKLEMVSEFSVFCFLRLHGLRLLVFFNIVSLLVYGAEMNNELK